MPQFSTISGSQHLQPKLQNNSRPRYDLNLQVSLHKPTIKGKLWMSAFFGDFTAVLPCLSPGGEGT